MIFGVDDDRAIVDLAKAQADAEIISRLIKERNFQVAILFDLDYNKHIIYIILKWRFIYASAN